MIKYTSTYTHTLFDTILPTKDHRRTPHPHYTIPYPHPIPPQAATQHSQDTTNPVQRPHVVTDEVPYQHETAVSQKLVSTLYSGLS